MRPELAHMLIFFVLHSQRQAAAATLFSVTLRRKLSYAFPEVSRQITRHCGHMPRVTRRNRKIPLRRALWFAEQNYTINVRC